MVMHLQRVRSRSPAPRGQRHADSHGPGEDVAAAQALREAYAPPAQSHFRVAAVLRFTRPDGSEDTIEAVNVEPQDANIRGAICAERAALCKFQACEEPTCNITRVVCVTDSPQPIFPGPMCREYLTSMCAPDTEIVVAGSKDPFGYFARPLSYLLPMPSVYRQKDVDEVKTVAAELREKVKPPTKPDFAKVYKAALEKAQKQKPQEMVFPVVFAAAVLFSDGSLSTASELKAIEYGGSVDAVTLLLPEMLRRRESEEQGLHPVALLQVDQFGVAHAPFAAARTLLVEHGLGSVLFAAHDDSGEWMPELAANESLPSAFLDWTGGVEGSH